MRKCAVRIVRQASDGACAKAAPATKSGMKQAASSGQRAGRHPRLFAARCSLPAAVECAAMKRILSLILVASCPFVANAKTMFVMHGGAGTITRQNMTAEAEAQ